MTSPRFYPGFLKHRESAAIFLEFSAYMGTCLNGTMSNVETVCDSNQGTKKEKVQWWQCLLQWIRLRVFVFKKLFCLQLYDMRQWIFTCICVVACKMHNYFWLSLMNLTKYLMPMPSCNIIPLERCVVIFWSIRRKS